MKATLGLGLRLAVSASILALVFSRVPLSELAARAVLAAPGYLAAALALALACVVLVALRWRLLARALGLAMPAALAVRTLFLALFGAQALPSAVGTDLLRGWLFARHASSLPRVVASLVADRLVALLSACLLLLFSSAGIERLFPAASGLVAPAAAGAAAAVLLGFLLYLRRGMRDVSLRPGPILLAIGIGVAVHLGTVVTAVLAAKAWSVEASFGLWIGVIPPVIIGAALPISLNGWGVREGLVVLLAVPLGVPAADALLVSVTLGIVNAFASLPGAILMLGGRRRGLGMMSSPPQ